MASVVTYENYNSTDDDLNDLSDLFGSSQGEYLEGEMSDIQDVNALVSSIKSSPLRSLLISPQKNGHKDDSTIPQYLLDNTKRSLHFTDISQYNATSSGYVSNISDISMISPVKGISEDSRKDPLAGSPQVNVLNVAKRNTNLIFVSRC